jgi:CheY-like chemotaxis protein
LFNENSLKFYAKDKSILLVDDDKIIISILKKSLEKYFSHVYWANDGQEAWDLYKNHHREFDIIITDINMPNMNGIELTKKLKDDNLENSVIVLSASQDVEFLVELIDIGVDSVVLKPLVFDKLAQKIIKLLEINLYKDLMFQLKKEQIIKECNLAQDNEKVRENLYEKYNKIAQNVVDVECKKHKKDDNKIVSKIEDIKSANDFFKFLETTQSKTEFTRSQEVIKQIISTSRELEQYGHELMFFIENISLEVDYTKAEELFAKMLELFHEMYELLNKFKFLETIAHQFFEIYSFLKSYKKTDYLTEQELECLSFDFIINDIKRFIDTVFIVKNSKDVLSFAKVLEADLDQMEIIIQTLDDIFHDE